MPNDRAFVRAERRLRSVLGCTHAALSSPLPLDPQRELQLALDKRNKRGEASVSFLDFEDKREASIDHARKRDPFRKDYGERRTVGENDFLEIAKGAAAVKLASLQLRPDSKGMEEASGSERRDKELIFGFTAPRSVHEIYRAWSFRLT